MGENADKFLNLYNNLHNILRQKLRPNQQFAEFQSLINLAEENNLITAHQKVELIRIANLRNVINHDKIFPKAIAEPIDAIVSSLEKIKSQIENPITVQSISKENPEVFEADETLLLDCLKYMNAKDYSQVVVHNGKIFGLITREDISRWFEQQIQDGELIISIRDIKISNISNVETKKDYAFLSKNATLLELVNAFQTQTREKISAVIITENGKNTETPLKIFTQWDLPDLISM